MTDYVKLVWTHIRNGRESVPLPDKKQLVRDEFIFTCPICGNTMSSCNYNHIGNFQVDAADHLETCMTNPAKCTMCGNLFKRLEMMPTGKCIRCEILSINMANRHE